MMIQLKRAIYDLLHPSYHSRQSILSSAKAFYTIAFHILLGIKLLQICKPYHLFTRIFRFKSNNFVCVQMNLLLNRIEDAVRDFGLSVQLNPDFAIAHLQKIYTGKIVCALFTVSCLVNARMRVDCIL